MTHPRRLQKNLSARGPDELRRDAECAAWAISRTGNIAFSGRQKQFALPANVRQRNADGRDASADVRQAIADLRDAVASVRCAQAIVRRWLADARQRPPDDRNALAE
jgi:hypothetical protein